MDIVTVKRTVSTVSKRVPSLSLFSAKWISTKHQSYCYVSKNGPSVLGSTQL